MEQILERHIQVRDFSYLLQKLIDKYSPLQIYCFHKDEQSRKVVGCFGDFLDAGHCDYWLLMITEGGVRIENAVQDFVNAHYELGKITILVHGREGIKKSIDDGYQFFANVFRSGDLLYNLELTINTLVPYSSALPVDQGRLRHRFEEGVSRAEGFLLGAKECLGSKKYNVCTFMLHQAVEQCCHALIWLNMDYRCDIHHLHRLLMLCRCFTEVPYQLFITGREEDRVAFDKLVKSYGNARYGADYEIQEDEIKRLIDKVFVLLVLTNYM